MKEKIFSRLKAGIAINGKTDVSDETLNAIVDAIGAQIADESKIDEALTPYIAAMKSVQGNINAVAAAAAKAEREARAELERQLNELKKQVPNLPPADPPKNGLTVEDVKKMLEDTIKPYTAKIAEFEQKDAKAAREADIAAKVKEMGLTDADMKYVQIPDDGDVTAFLTGYKQHLIDRGLKPIDPNGQHTPDPKNSEEVAKGWLESVGLKK